MREGEQGGGGVRGVKGVRGARGERTHLIWSHAAARARTNGQ